MAPGATTSTRWCPTPEQLMILEEMYRGGVRTPNATQIQHITAHLSLYGKIEGKNVFYWFQNHKARDRQKLRRRLAKHLLLEHHQHHLLYHHDQFFDHLHHHHHPPPVDDPFFPSIHPSSLPPSGFHPVSALDHYYAPSPAFVPPQGDVSCEYAMNLSWKMEMNPARGDVRDEDPATRAHGDDWVVISSNLNSRPLKTLELFPVTSSTSCHLNDEPPSLAR